jgi:hypothetical protein
MSDNEAMIRNFYSPANGSKPESKYVGSQELLDGGYVQEVNRQFFHPLGMALSVNEDGELNVLDNRASPEGMYFLDGVISFVKVMNVSTMQELRRQIRKKKLGFNIQPPVSSDDLVSDVVKGME